MRDAEWEPRVKILGRVYLGAFSSGAELTGTKIRALLVTMILQANRTVSLERIVEALWDDEPPRSAIANIRSFACLLRARLPDPARLESRIGGYELVVGEGDCDHTRFLALADGGRTALRRGQTARAADVLGAALRQWHGDRAAIGVARIGPLAVWLTHLDEERELVMEDLAEAYLRLGEPRAALRDLNALLGAAPVRSRAWALCMRAYHMNGDLDQVADVYRRARAAYQRGLGVPPDGELDRLYLEMMAAGALRGGRAAPEGGSHGLQQLE